MPKNNQEKRKKAEQDLNSFLEKLKHSDNMDEDELKELGDLLHNVIVENRFSLKKRVLCFLKLFFTKFMIKYLISILVFGLLMSNILINKFDIFYISIGISFFLTLLEILPMLSHKVYPISYSIVFILTIVNFCLFNNIYSIFQFSSLWIVYFLILELFYCLVITTLIRRKILL